MEAVTEFDTTVAQMSEKYMCSQVCPCFLDEAVPWTQLTEAELNEHGRTAIPGLDPTDTVGRMRMEFTTINGVVTYSSFKECLDYLLVLDEKPDGMPSKEDYEILVKIATYFEHKYECSGVCTPPLFFLAARLE